jgi:hypothetical protein
LGNLPSAILWTWPYHVSWFCSLLHLQNICQFYNPSGHYQTRPQG